MTNPNANDLLRLARAVYPDKPWQVDEERTIPFLGNGMYFYPEHFDSQFIDTLAWLSKNVCCQRFRHGFLELRPLAVVFSIAASGDDSRAVAIDHDGTASGIRAAVVEAAVRVVPGA